MFIFLVAFSQDIKAIRAVGEHLAGALLHEGFEVSFIRKTPWHGYLYAASLTDQGRRKRSGGSADGAARSGRSSRTSRAED
jgi:hypothetical protein